MKRPAAHPETDLVALALECSTSQGSLAICSGNSCLYEASWQRISSHGEWVLPAIEQALNFAQLKIEDVDVFGVGLGPGSFTGIRVAINAMKSLAYTQQKPIVGVDSLRLLAEKTAKIPSRLPICAILDSQDTRILVATFDRTTKGIRVRREPHSILPDELAREIKKTHLIAGNADHLLESLKKKKSRFGRFLKMAEWIPRYPDARTLAQIALHAATTDQTKAWNQIEPVYVRASSAEEKMRKGKSEA